MSGRRDESMLLDDLVAAANRLVDLGSNIPAGMLGVNEGDGERIMWNLVVLGESTKRLGPETRARFTDVPWSDMAETRDRVVHHYEGIDWQVVAGVIDDDLPALLPRLLEIRAMLRAESDADEARRESRG
jgi:uncharacterized protein with HEPN domain